MNAQTRHFQLFLFCRMDVMQKLMNFHQSKSNNYRFKISCFPSANRLHISTFTNFLGSTHCLLTVSFISTAVVWVTAQPPWKYNFFFCGFCCVPWSHEFEFYMAANTFQMHRICLVLQTIWHSCYQCISMHVLCKVWMLILLKLWMNDFSTLLTMHHCLFFQSSPPKQ